jgi:two-component system, chemotaxis family, response regulator Rcp1
VNTTPEILMADDNPADIDLTSEVLAQSGGRYHMNAVNDGEEALSFLRREGKYARAPVPDLVVLDLNLPRKDGCEVLSNIKADPVLARIPVVIFTTSQANSDVTRSYEVGANCYLRKPGNLAEFVAAVQSMAEFWLGFASLPRREKR